MKEVKPSIFVIGDCKILQSERAMKVSTDSILLAKYCKKLNYNHVLEIGCGIGLITFLLHKNSANAKFQGIDIQPEAIQLAMQSLVLNNITNSIQFNVIDIQNFSSKTKYDLIVSNPPYFINQLNSANVVRNNFRHSDRKFITSFSEKCKELCSDKLSNIVIIIPSQMESIWSTEMAQKGFALNELVDLRYKENYESDLIICNYSLNCSKFNRSDWIYGRETW